MQIVEVIQLTERALALLDQAGMGTTPAACHLQMALDILPSLSEGGEDQDILLGA